MGKKNTMSRLKKKFTNKINRLVTAEIKLMNIKTCMATIQNKTDREKKERSISELRDNLTLFKYMYKRNTIFLLGKRKNN